MPVAPHPTCGQGHTPVGPVNNWPKWHDWKVPTPFKPHESLAGTSGSHRAGLLLTPFQQLSSRLFVPLPSRGSVCSFASSTSPDRLLLFSTSSGGLLLLVTAASPFLSPILLFSLLCQSICSAFPRHLSPGSTTLLSCRSHQFLEISVSRLRLRLRRQLLPLLLPSLLLSRSASIPSTANPLRASGFLLYSSRRISYQLLVIRVRKLSLRRLSALAASLAVGKLPLGFRIRFYITLRLYTAVRSCWHCTSQWRIWFESVLKT